MSNKKISELSAAALALQDDDVIEGEFAAGGVSRKFTGLEVRTVEMEERIEADEAIHDAVGLDESGNFIPFSGTNHVDAATSIANAIELLDAAVEPVPEELWEEVLGVVKPIADADVEVVNLTAQLIETDDIIAESAEVTTEMLLTYLAGSGNKMVMVDNTGVLSSKSFGYRVQQDTSGSVTLDLTAQTIYASATSANVVLTLPTATALTKGHSYYVTKITGNYGVVLTAAGGQAISHSTGVSGAYTLSSRGEWVTIRSVETAPGTYGWVIEQFGGRATSGGGGVTRGVIGIDSSVLTEYNIETTYLYVNGFGNANIDLFLPAISSVGIIDFVVRKTGGTGALSLFTSGGDTIDLDADSGEGVYTTTIGGWVRVMSDGEGKWHVVSDNGEYAITI